MKVKKVERKKGMKNKINWKEVYYSIQIFRAHQKIYSLRRRRDTKPKSLNNN